MFTFMYIYHTDYIFVVFSIVKISQLSYLQVSDTFNITGNCDYAVVLRHPSGCAKVIYVNGKGWGWFGTLMMIILCLLVGYVLVGTIYRFFFLGIQGIEVRLSNFLAFTAYDDMCLCTGSTKFHLVLQTNIIW